MRLGEPTSSRPSGVTVAAFSPYPASRIARAASCDDLVRGRAARLERQVVAHEVEIQPEDLRIEHAKRLLEELLAGLVALEDDDAQGVGHGAGRYRGVRRRHG